MGLGSLGISVYMITISRADRSPRVQKSNDLRDLGAGVERDSIIRSLSLETLAGESERVRLLSYAPGPMDTEMTRRDLMGGGDNFVKNSRVELEERRPCGFF